MERQKKYSKSRRTLCHISACSSSQVDRSEYDKYVEIHTDPLSQRAYDVEVTSY